MNVGYALIFGFLFVFRLVQKIWDGLFFGGFYVVTTVKKLGNIKLPKPPTLPKFPKLSKLPQKNPIKLRERVFYFFLGALAALIFFVVPYQIYLWFVSLPSADLLVVEGNKRPTVLLDRNGELLYEIYVDRKYSPVKLNQIPKEVVDATLAVEDAQFYKHNGVRPVSMLRAAYKTVVDHETQGASTITQQLVKNVLLTPERTMSRKLKEFVLALMVESKYSKDQILELYLNNISYGGVAWGVQTASQKYYGKNVWELNLAEASMLAGLPGAPSTFSPLTDLSLAKQRQLHVLNRMYDLGYITKTELVAAFEEELTFAEQGDYIKAPHFVQYVRRELEKIYGKRFVEYGGLTVTTTLDVNLQDEVEKIVKEEVDKSVELNVSNGAVVVLDAKKARILAYAGSLDYFGTGWGAYDVATAYRQPGSSIKPVTYALALTKNYTAASVIADKKITYPVPNQRPYTPVNYDGKYHGDVTFREALANSYNIPAVKIAHSVGPDNIVDLGKKMGLINWEVDGTYGLSVTLGGKEVRLLDLTNVYATFARGGNYLETSPFLSIKDNFGHEIYNDSRSPLQVLSAEASYIIWNILSDNGARSAAFGYNNYLNMGNYKVAVKTGTTDNKRDNWTLGFTPSYAVGVWVGNNNNTPMNPYLSSGLTGAAPIWNRVFKLVLKDKQNEVPPLPEGVFTKYDGDCGKTEYFIKGSNVPKSLCPSDKDKEKRKNRD